MTCISVLEHIEKWTLAMKEAYRVLKKDGYFIMTTPNKGFCDPKRQGIFRFYYKKMNHNHIKLFEIKELKKILLNIGFRQVEVYGIGHRMLGYLWMFFRPLELLFPVKILRPIIKCLAVRNLDNFSYKGDQSTTIIAIARK